MDPKITFLFIFINIFLLFFFKKLSSFINIFDYPDSIRKFHKKKIALIGGYIILINLLLIFSINYFFKEYLSSSILNEKKSLFFIISCSALFFLGTLDDKYLISANKKLFISSIILLFFLYFDNQMILREIRFSFLEKKIILNNFSFFFTLFCFLLFINAFNMFDGINLQSAIYSLSIFFLFILKDIFIDISIIMILSLLFFSYLNFKNKCFLGNNGALVIAFVISYLFIKSQSSTNPFLADEIFLAMQIPGLDLLRLAIQRILEKKHPFYPDTNHIHHLLMKRYGFKKTLFFLLSLIIIPNFLSVLYGNTFYYIILSLIVYLLIIFKLKK